MTKLYIFILTLFFLNCQGQNNFENESPKEKRVRQDALIKKYIKNCAEKHNYKYQMAEWQACLDKGLEQDSTVAYFWQQKAMPYFKAKKYEVGMYYLDKAVLYNSQGWLDYRAFIKCIFLKTYKDALVDFKLCLAKDGNTYVMDHTYKFHMALCHLQLNHYQKAEIIFKEDIKAQEKEWGEAHYLDQFYYGISLYEQQKWEKAILQFNKSLEQYPTFSDAKYYKAICLSRLRQLKAYSILIKEARHDFEMGNTINEANAIYETYPYQVRW